MPCGTPLFIGLHWVYFSFVCHKFIQSSFGTSFRPPRSVFCPLSFDETLVSCSYYDFLVYSLEVTLICVPSRESPLVCIGMFTSHSFHPCKVNHFLPPSIVSQGGPISVLHFMPISHVHNITSFHISNTSPLLD